MAERERPIHIFDIQRFSLHDGPGIRTTVFFSGCPLRCPWCANPESQRGGEELLYFQSKCVSCGRCATACPHGAVGFSLETGPVFHREKCSCCGKCADVCLSEALELSGKVMTVEEILSTVRRDRDYYEKTGGGITVSGGEPFVQPEGLDALLKAAKNEGFHTAVETTGSVSGTAFQKGSSSVDLFLFDLKYSQPEVLRTTTGGDLQLILQNLRLAVGSGNEVCVRIPVIPGFNHSPEAIDGILSLASDCGAKAVELLPYHTLGKGKYVQLGRTYPMGDTPPLDKGELRGYADLGAKRNMTVTIRGGAA